METTLFPSATFGASNYWVDVVFTTGTVVDSTPPTVSSTAPASAATGVGTSAAVSATFSEPIDAASLTSASFELRGAANALVAASVTYNAATRVATLTPSAAMAAATSYTATVTTAVRDTAGNAMAGARTGSWSEMRSGRFGSLR